MARLDPAEGFEILKSHVKDAISSSFPQEGAKNVLKLESLDIPDKLSVSNVGEQKAAKMNGRTWGVPVHATLVLEDKKTGKVLDRSKIKIATLPKVTNRYSYIVEGSEYQVDNQWRLKPGVYTKVQQNGELDSFFNIQGQPLHLGFDPKERSFVMKHGGAQPPLYPIMRALGHSDGDLEKAWGKDILNANMTDSRGKVLKVDKHAIAFAKRLVPEEEITTLEKASEVIKQKFAESRLHPDVTSRTLGKAIDKITPEAMLRSSQRLLGVARGTEKPDVRDSLMFKEFLSTEDFIGERIKQSSPVIQRRIGNNIDRRDKIRDIVGMDVFQRPVKEFFSKVSLASTPEQTNPLKMISGQLRTTIAGEGGVKDANRITEDAKLVDPSHFGVLDPLHTPESVKTGVNLQLALGTRKVGTRVEIPLIHARTGKVTYLDPGKINDAMVALPDSVKRVNGKFSPKEGSTVLVSGPGNELMRVPMKDVEYVVPRSSQMFSIATNMVPFISSDSPNRATMAGRHMEQAIPLVNPEAPLVQSVLGKKSFDELVGSYASHAAPADGTVLRVEKDAIHIKGSDKKTHIVHTYDHYPTNDKKGMIHSNSLVKAGDKVTKGQVVADTNFTKNGVYAPGKNLQVAYMPWRGYNFEDGVVISETAAQKLTSEHLHKKGLSTKEAQLLGTKKYQAYYQDRLNKEQAAKLDPDGVVKPGMRVKPGDTLIAALAEQQLTTEEQKLKLLHKSLVRPFKDKAITWDEDVEGEVIEVNKRGTRVDVHVKTAEPMDVGDKLVGRHGNKGIVTMILPDHEMPKTKDGKPIEVIMNPIGTPGRMNIGQVLETAAAKIAQKTGQPFKVTNFEVENNLEFVENELKKHGLTDKESIIDPKTGREIPNIQVGPQYILKMEHQVGKKMAARSRDSYDRNLVPKGGGPHGAQALGSLGIYSMLAHGAKANIREMQTYKSDKSQGGDNDELWSALQAGEMLPPPRTTFAYNKFNSYLKALGVNTEKDGNSLNLVPLTDKDVLSMSNGELKDAGRVVKMRTLQPEKNGLFDPKITGGHDGTNWSHIKLTSPMPNPLFEKAIMSVAGIRGPQFDKIIGGTAGVTKDGAIVEQTGVKGATYGPAAIDHLLAKVDIKKDLAVEEARIQGLKGQLQNESRRKIKYLRALDKLGMKPTDAYMMKHVPILPPNMRPIAVLDDGSLQTDDLNEIYKQLAIVNKKHGEFPANAPQSLKAPLQEDIYDHLKSLTGLGGTLNRKHPGILDVLSGREGPKTSFAQDVLIKRKQDLTMRSTIVPEPSLSLDEAEIPRKAAKEMYKPFLVRELRRTAGVTPLAAKKMIDEDDPLANKALDRVVQERPVLLKRDPVLHKYGIQAFKPRLVEGKAIKIHPLVCSGFNADFDGDTMSAYVPITAEAVKEAEQMFPSRNLFSPATGSVMYTPGHEAQVGLFMMADAGKWTGQRFKSQAELESAVRAGKATQNDVVMVGNVKTTLGRLQINSHLPKDLQGGKLLTDLNYRFTKKEQEKLFNGMVKVDRAAYPSSINKLKDLGNEAATMGSFSFGLGDFKVHKDIRDPILRSAEAKAAKLDLSKKDQLNKFIDIYEGATNEIDEKLKQRIADPKFQTNLVKLEVAAGIKGRGLRQLTAAPVLFVDGKGEVVTSPVKKSYAEGLSSGDYWAATSGGRKGAIQKVQSVSEPGYLTKQMANSTLDMLVAANDCGTSRGVNLHVDEPDVIGRYTVADLKLQKGIIPANTLVTPEILSRIKNAKIDKVVVRSPMRCVHGKGVCAKCMGLNENGKLNDLGTNVGILATQSIGERGTQLAMKAFHSGGVYEGREAATKSIAAGGLDRAGNILNLPQKLKGSAILSTTVGRVNKIEKDPAGGVRVSIGDKEHYVPADRAMLDKVRVGYQVKKGDPITNGPVNPHELLPLTNMSKVQGHLAGELHSIYGQYGIKRRHSELMVRALSNVTKVENPGGNPDLLPGDFTSTSQVYEWNKQNPKTKPVVHTPVLRGVKTIPLDIQEDWMARLNHEHLKSTLVEAAQQGWQSNLHGMHPIPPLMHGAEFGKGTKDKPWAY